MRTYLAAMLPCLIPFGVIYHFVPMRDLTLCFVEIPRADINLGPWTLSRFLPPLPDNWSLKDFLVLRFYDILIFLTYPLAIRSAWKTNNKEIASLAILGLLLYGSWVKSQSIFCMSIPAFILLPIMIERYNSKALAVALSLMFAVMFKCHKIVSPPNYERLNLVGAEGMLVSTQEADNLRGVIRVLSKDNSDFYVWSDGGQGGPYMIYFLMHRDPPTHIYEQFNGVTTRPEIQKRIIEDLKRNHVTTIVRFYAHDDSYPRAHLLDGFISQFHSVAKFGDFEVLQGIGIIPA